MAFFQRLLAAQCAHRFAWPRVDSHGQHYQICVLCGTAYQYDWKGMRRTNRRVVPAPDSPKTVTENSYLR